MSAPAPRTPRVLASVLVVLIAPPAFAVLLTIVSVGLSLAALPFGVATGHATPGPNGLLRHRLEPNRQGTRCIAHGEGTWDSIVGEFS